METKTNQLESIERRSFMFMEYRIIKRLPIQTIGDFDFIKDRFYWIVDKFKEQYIVGGEDVNTLQYFNQIGKAVIDGIDNLNLGDLEDFKKGIACSMLAVALENGCSLKVPQEFFIDQFLRVVDQRFYRQHTFMVKEFNFFANVLVDAGAIKETVFKIVEAGSIHAETAKDYDYPLVQFIGKVIEGIINECNRLELPVTHEMLMPHSYILMLNRAPGFNSNGGNEPEMMFSLTKE